MTKPTTDECIQVLKEQIDFYHLPYPNGYEKNKEKIQMCFSIIKQLESAKGMYKSLTAPEIEAVIGKNAFAYAFQAAGGTT